jgi:thiazole/oxazole-forming peptide maturase SagD family component
LRRHQHHFSPITGVVQTLARSYQSEDDPAPVFDAGYNVARQGDSLGDLEQIFRARSSGKGATEVQARASGLCEAIERYSCVFHGDEARWRGRWDQVREVAIHPHQQLLFSETQYRERRARNEGQRKRAYTIPEPFDEDAAIEWSPAFSLTHQRMRKVATALCYYGYRDPGAAEFCWADSNGCAAGNVVEEAVLQGFLELVERDAVALWWYNRVAGRPVDLSTFPEPYFSRLAEHYHALGRELWVLDLTTDVGIPVFAAISRRTSGAEQITIGFGAHLEARIAIMRALTELNQFLPMITGPELLVSDVDVGGWLRTARLDEQPHLRAVGPSRRSPDYPALATEDLSDDVQRCVQMAAARGLEVLVHTMTRPDVGLPVVKVMVPGLRHFWPRFAPGRLYDVPVQLGWRSSPSPEAELNPIPVFF